MPLYRVFLLMHYINLHLLTLLTYSKLRTAWCNERTSACTSATWSCWAAAAMGIQAVKVFHWLARTSCDDGLQIVRTLAGDNSMHQHIEFILYAPVDRQPVLLTWSHDDQRVDPQHIGVARMISTCVARRG